MAKPRSFRQINTGQELQLIQDNIEKAIAGAISSPLLDGRLISTVALVSGTTKVEHKLDRVPQGYLIVDRNNGALIYTASKDSKFLSLTSTLDCTISLWVF